VDRADVSLAKLRRLEPDMQKCFRCSLCKMAPLPTVLDPRYSNGCPASRELHFHGYSGSGKSITALSLLEGRIEVDRALAEIAFACTACGLCDVSCKFIMEAERHQINTALREHVVDRGFGPSAHRLMIDNLEEHGHPEGNARASSSRWTQDLGVKVAATEAAPVLLFAGCEACREADALSVVRKLALLLDHAGVDFAVLGDEEGCCGLPAYWTGYRDLFTRIADETAGRFDGSGAETIVTVSGSCLGAVRSKYPEYARSPRAQVVHATEFLARLIEEGRLRLPNPVARRVTYHDPCYLGRQSEPPLAWEGEYRKTHGCMTYADPPREINRGVHGVFDEPRRILRAINALDFVEMDRIREYAFCCGGGGGVPRAYPELARKTALHRIEEAAGVGAECLVTACHHCRANLSEAQASREYALPIVDIIDLVYEASGIEG
jgi:Fe-S oxidoreductase